MKVIRNIVVIAVLLTVLGIFYISSRSDRSDDVSNATEYFPEEKAIAVEAVEASSGQIVPEIRSSGILRGVNEAVVISETRGVIVEVYQEIGAALKAGDPILGVDDSIAKLSMKQAEQQFKSAEMDFDAVSRAYASGGASESEMIRAQSQLAGAKAGYEESVKRFENSVLKAPIDGYLADLDSSLEEGNYISEGSRAASIIDIDRVRVDIFVGDDEVMKIKPGASAVLEVAGRRLEGEVKASALTSDRSTGSFRVIVEADNPYGDEMRSGFTADVILKQLDSKEHILVPSAALFKVGNEEYVYIEDSGKAVLTGIKRGISSGNMTEILSGIEEGDIVVISGLNSLADGSRIMARIIDSAGGEI